MDIIGGAPSNVLGYFKIFQRWFYMVLGSLSPKITFIQNIQKRQIMKNTTLLFMSRITLIYTDMLIIVTSLRLKLKADGY